VIDAPIAIVPQLELLIIKVAEIYSIYYDDSLFCKWSPSPFLHLHLNEWIGGNGISLQSPVVSISNKLDNNSIRQVLLIGNGI